MKLFSGRHYFLASLAAITLAGCATEAPVGADGTKIAVAKCNRVADVPLGSLTKKDCTSGNPNQVDKQEFMNALQVPGSVPQH